MPSSSGLWLLNAAVMTPLWEVFQEGLKPALQAEIAYKNKDTSKMARKGMSYNTQYLQSHWPSAWIISTVN